ncbi:MAG: S-adenosylmethionine:tRNA ribosyltransferase-isomerase [Flavobacteriales bacterium]|nr:S-adenosylmethionine:tRNA ribosyltransferase-isomerase [Flavobacteriales bacterium]
MLPKEIHINDFDYPLPEERIALFPVEPRDSSKLLRLEGNIITHHRFKELPQLLPSNTLLVFNQTRVIQARLKITKATGAQIEIFLLEPIYPSPVIMQTMGATKQVHWHCMIGNKKRWKENEVIYHHELEFSWVDREHDVVCIAWNDNRVFAEVLAEVGNMPIPPYIKREAVEKDKEVYQTVYATQEGSVAAPTAGLHFTEHVLQDLEKQGIKKEFITLHVGAGTFKPVSTENALEHEMHAEKMFFSRDNIMHLMQHEGPIIPVGTTSMRSLESLYWFGVGLIQQRLESFTIPQYFPYEHACNISLQQSLQRVLTYMDQQHLENLEGVTSIYIVPGYEFRVCRGIITNFHQPKSTLLLLISALIGEQWKTVYHEALQNNYRFLSYGDSSLLLSTKSMM